MKNFNEIEFLALRITDETFEDVFNTLNKLNYNLDEDLKIKSKIFGYISISLSSLDLFFEYFEDTDLLISSKDLKPYKKFYSFKKGIKMLLKNIYY